MKSITTKLTITILFFALCTLGFSSLGINPFSEKAMLIEKENIVKESSSENNEEDGAEGPEMERHYFEKWNEPYGAELPIEVSENIWNGIKRLPREEDLPGTSIVNSWNFVGPYGMNNTSSTGTRYSGRILDIDLIHPANFIGGIRIASASGGIWGYALGFP